MVDLQVATISGSSATLNDSAVEEFQKSLRGQFFRPGDAGYDETRQLWNAMIDKRPALIARCLGASDVINCVNFAREHDLLVAVRGGGHSFPGKSSCDDGLVIDLSPMKGIRVDPAQRTVRAEPGVRWNDFDRETLAFGLATTGGTVSDTGIAGLTLGGGFGWLMRSRGLSCDNLLSADVVTADGRLLTASEQENPDLFWGLRGGGGNFGVVTSFEYRLHPMGPSVLGGMLAYPFEKAREVFQLFRDVTSQAPDELVLGAGLLTSPEGEKLAAILGCYSGPPDQGEQLIKPLREFGPPVMDQFGPVPYTAVQTMIDDAAPPGNRYYLRSDFLEELPQGAIDTMVERFAGVPSPLTAVLVFHMGGAVGRVPRDATAFPHRNALYDFEAISIWNSREADEQNRRWTRELGDAMHPYASGGVYVNGLEDDEGADRVQAAYGSNYRRLAELKSKFDPTNFFRLNQNITPTV